MEARKEESLQTWNRALIRASTTIFQRENTATHRDKRMVITTDSLVPRASVIFTPRPVSGRNQ